jgi:hypothetical protein
MKILDGVNGIWIFAPADLAEEYLATVLQSKVFLFSDICIRQVI